MSAASTTLRALLVSAALASSCSRADRHDTPAELSPPPRIDPLAPVDREKTTCAARIDDLMSVPALAGAPAFESARAEILGRARGEPMFFVREPASSAVAPESAVAKAALLAFSKGAPGARVERLARALRAEPRALRAILLRQGYLYASDPLDALELSLLHLRDLADEPTLFLARGTHVRQLRRVDRKAGRAYVWDGGDDDGKDADLLFGDRLATDGGDLATPLHRDVRALAAEIGFDRARVLHLGEHEIVAELRFGDVWVRTVLESEGAKLRVACREAPDEELATLGSWVDADAPRRRALAKLSTAVTSAVEETLRFDRPEGEKTAERDGQLRPVWYAAYLRGNTGFEFDGATYPTRDAAGRPWPPEVCVDFVLDSYERASGTWFRGRGEPPGRVRGALDFDAHKIENRRGVLGFMKFAEKTPELFQVRHFEGKERIPFGERTAFFRFLVDHADEFRPGDVLAIQGRKRDGLIHQHAILLEATDPLSGFPYGLADQMKRPRRRTWEGIMAEAPLRSLLYRARPTDAVLLAGER